MSETYPNLEPTTVITLDVSTDGELKQLIERIKTESCLAQGTQEICRTCITIGRPVCQALKNGTIILNE